MPIFLHKILIIKTCTIFEYILYLDYIYQESSFSTDSSEALIM